MYTGLRPGEKLYEELLASKEHTKPTYHDKIMIANVKNCEFKATNHQILGLLESAYNESEELIVARMKDLVPEFIPQNERYRRLIVARELSV